MICIACRQTCPIPVCSDNILIGRIEQPNIDVYVVFEEVLTGRRKMLIVTSDDSGNITADVGDIKAFFSPNFLYKIWIQSDSSTGCSDIDLIISGIYIPCVKIKFFVCTDIEPGIAILKLIDTTDTIDDDTGNPIQDDSYNSIEP